MPLLASAKSRQINISAASLHAVTLASPPSSAWSPHGPCIHVPHSSLPYLLASVYLFPGSPFAFHRLVARRARDWPCWRGERDSLCSPTCGVVGRRQSFYSAWMRSEGSLAESQIQIPGSSYYGAWCPFVHTEWPFRALHLFPMLPFPAMLRRIAE